MVNLRSIQVHDNYGHLVETEFPSWNHPAEPTRQTKGNGRWLNGTSSVIQREFRGGKQNSNIRKEQKKTSGTPTGVVARRDQPNGRSFGAARYQASSRLPPQRHLRQRVAKERKKKTGEGPLPWKPEGVAKGEWEELRGRISFRGRVQ